MKVVFFRAGLGTIGVALLFSVSCEEHHVGEYPEIQRDRLAEAKHADRSEHGGAPEASPTPVQFFPEKKSP